MYRVKVTGPAVDGPFGAAAYVVASPQDIREVEGVLMITMPARPRRPYPHDPSRFTQATRSTQVIYPRGGWHRVIIDDVIEEDDNV